MHKFLFFGFIGLAACSSKTDDGSGGGGASATTDSTVTTTTTTDATNSATGATSSVSGAGGGGDVTLPTDQYLIVGAFWSAPANAGPAGADFVARIDVTDLAAHELPEGSVTVGNGAADLAVPYTEGQVPPYQTTTQLDYTGVITFDDAVDGEHGFGTVDLGFPWITDFAVATPAVAASEIDFTWTATPEAMCTIKSFGTGGSYSSTMFADEGHFELPPDSIDPSPNQTLLLDCFKVVYGTDNGYVVVTQTRDIVQAVE